MLCIRPTVLLVFAFLAIFQALADEPSEATRKQKEVQAVSKAEYDRMVQSLQAMEILESLGITLDDIDPNSLPFESTSLFQCWEEAEKTVVTGDELQISRVACIKRHSARPVPINPD